MLRDAVRLDQPVGFRDVEFFGRQQDGRHAARDLHELMHAGAVRQRRHHERGIALGGAGHQVGEMIGHHKGHLAVGEHRRLGAAGRARGEEEPAGIVVVDARLLHFRIRLRSNRLGDAALAECAGLADAPGESQCRARRLHRRRMIGKIAMTEERLGAGGGGEIGDLVRHQAEIGRHPDGAEPEGRKHRPEHLVAILGMHEDAVALGDAARGQRRRQRSDLCFDLAPGKALLAPDEADAVASRRAFCVSM